MCKSRCCYAVYHILPWALKAFGTALGKQKIDHWPALNSSSSTDCEVSQGRPKMSYRWTVGHGSVLRISLKGQPHGFHSRRSFKILQADTTSEPKKQHKFPHFEYVLRLQICQSEIQNFPCRNLSLSSQQRGGYRHRSRSFHGEVGFPWRRGVAEASSGRPVVNWDLWLKANGKPLNL